MRADRHRGFTLVEMLIAIGILAMIAALGWRGLDSMLRSRVALTESMQQTRAMQRTFAQLQDDCAQIAAQQAIVRYARVRVQPNRLALIRNVFESGQPTSLQGVVYQVENGVLRRRESIITRDLPTIERFLQQPDSSATRDAALQEGIYGMTARTWNGSWRTDAVPLAATGLELTFMLQAGEGQITRSFLLGTI